MNRMAATHDVGEPCAALVTPVGGNWQAPLAAIRSTRAEKVVFLVSSSTEPFIANIRAQYENPISDVDWIVTPDHESVSATLRVLKDRLPEIINKWHVPWEEVLVDLTGGTKVMVAALMLATIHRARRFIYVGGDTRDSQGVGVVVTGTERPVHFINPWDETAEEARRQIYWAFNNLQLGTAERLARNAVKMVSGENRAYLELLLKLIYGFSAWDRFDYREALNTLRKTGDYLEMVWNRMPGHEPLVSRLANSIAWLASLENARREGIPTRRFLEDLLSNAWRRGEIEQKYDDGVARLYRFIEGLAQQSLWEIQKLRTGAIPPEMLPSSQEWDDLREDARRGKKQTVELGLARSYSLLAEFGHPLGSLAARLGQNGDLGRLLSVRNQSLLAHGVNPVTQKDFRSLLTACLEISGLTEGDLVKFLELPE